MRLNYVRNQTKTQADIYLYGGIGYDINGDDVAAEIRYLDSLGLNNINIRINSGGGSIISGGSIIAAILASKTTINTYNDFIAASMAGMILICGDKVFMSDIATLMIHEPLIGSETIDTTKDEKTKRALEALRDQLATVIIQKTGVKREEANELMNFETWYNAQRAKKDGFVDEIIKSNIKPNIKNTIDIDKMAASYTALINNKTENMKEIISHFNIEVKENENKEKVIIEHIENAVSEIQNELNESNKKLDEEKQRVSDLENKVTELSVNENIITELEDAKNALETSKEEIQNITTERDELKEKIEELANESEAVKDKLAVSAVSATIDAGIFDEKEREELEAKAKNNLSLFEFYVKSFKKPVAKVTDFIKNEEAEDNASWTIRDWEKNDPKGLQNIMNTNPTRYERMYNEYYKKIK